MVVLTAFPVEIFVNHIIPFTNVSELTLLWDVMEALLPDDVQVWSSACYGVIDRDLWSHVQALWNPTSAHVDKTHHDVVEFAWYCMLPRVVSHFRPARVTREKLVTLDRLLADIQSLSILSVDNRAILDNTPSWRRTAWVYNTLKQTYPDITSWV